MVVSILIEVTMFMVVVVVMVVSVSSVPKTAITTKSSSEATKTPGQGRSLVIPMRLQVRLVVVHFKVMLKVVHMVVILWMGLTLEVNTRLTAVHHHHQKRPNLSTYKIIVVSESIVHNSQ